MYLSNLKIDPQVMLGDFAQQGGATELCFIPAGMSMYPFVIGGRDVVRLRKQSHVGLHDIVVAHVAGRGYLLHRVYDLRDDRLTLMGDNNLAMQEVCGPGDVVGVVTHINDRPCDAVLFKMLSAVWVRLLFVRKYLLWVLRKIDKRL